MSREDCLHALETFGKRLYRFAETSDPGALDPLPQGNICVHLSVEGSFGVADDLFEAIRVMGGFKLPRIEGDA